MCVGVASKGFIPHMSSIFCLKQSLTLACNVTERVRLAGLETSRELPISASPLPMKGITSAPHPTQPFLYEFK